MMMKFGRVEAGVGVGVSAKAAVLRLTLSEVPRSKSVDRADRRGEQDFGMVSWLLSQLGGRLWRGTKLWNLLASEREPREFV
jgi:hypothetical protein